MAEFDKLRFLRLLREAPSREPLLEPPEYSEYLQKQVFDKLKEDGTVDLRSLDLDAIFLRDLVPADYPAIHDRAVGGWAQGFNCFARKTPAAHLKQREFF